MPNGKRSIKEIQIKRLGARDKPAAKELLNFFKEDDGQKPSPVDETYLSKLLGKRSFYVLVAYKNNLLVGGLTAYALPMFKNKASEMFLFEIGVKKEFRRQGIGNLLIRRLKELALAKKMKMMFVLTSPGNVAGRKLYGSAGGVLQKDIFFLIPLTKKSEPDL